MCLVDVAKSLRALRPAMRLVREGSQELEERSPVLRVPFERLDEAVRGRGEILVYSDVEDALLTIGDEATRFRLKPLERLCQVIHGLVRLDERAGELVLHESR